METFELTEATNNQNKTVTDISAEKAGEKTEQRHHRHYYRPEIEIIRLILMACAILYTYNLHPILGETNAILLGFAFPALYIISGYLVLRESENIEKRILRAIKRTAICFGILFAAYLGLSLIFEWGTTIAQITTKRFWFDFIVLNDCNLPIGFPIWYVQALLYAYIIVYFIHKLKLLKFDIYIAVLCLVITALVGEFSGLIGFNFFGHTYISGNFLTRALPYILIGSFIQRKSEFFDSIELKDVGMLFLIGLILTFGEYILLSYIGIKVYVSHLLGMTFTAVAVSVFSFNAIGMEIMSEPLQCLTQCELMIPFFVCSPVQYLCSLCLKLNIEVENVFSGFLGIITTAISFLILLAYAYICDMIKRRKDPKEKQDGGKGFFGRKNKRHRHRHHHHHYYESV